MKRGVKCDMSIAPSIMRLALILNAEIFFFCFASVVEKSGDRNDPCGDDKNCLVQYLITLLCLLFRTQQNFASKASNKSNGSVAKLGKRS